MLCATELRVCCGKVMVVVLRDKRTVTTRLALRSASILAPQFSTPQGRKSLRKMYDFIVVESPLLPPGVRMAQVGAGSRQLRRRCGVLDVCEPAHCDGCFAVPPNQSIPAAEL